MSELAPLLQRPHVYPKTLFSMMIPEVRAIIADRKPAAVVLFGVEVASMSARVLTARRMSACSRQRWI